MTNKCSSVYNNPQRGAKMYNKKQKEGFCESYLRSRVIAKTSLYGFFNKIEPYEINGIIFADVGGRG